MEGQIAVEEKNKARLTRFSPREDVKAALERAGLGGSVFLWGHETRVQGSTLNRMLFYVKARPEMRGDAIKDARASIDRGGMSMGQAIVELEMNSKGARTFARVTAANIQKYLAIVLDSTVYSAPVIRSKIPSGRAQIEGSFTMEEAKNLAVVLRAGALPRRLKSWRNRSWAPPWARIRLKRALLHPAIGFGLIIIFMVFYYRSCGLIADGALVLHILFVLGMMAAINATLTLPVSPVSCSTWVWPSTPTCLFMNASVKSFAWEKRPEAPSTPDITALSLPSSIPKSSPCLRQSYYSGPARHPSRVLR